MNLFSGFMPTHGDYPFKDFGNSPMFETSTTTVKNSKITVDEDDTHVMLTFTHDIPASFEIKVKIELEPLVVEITGSKNDVVGNETKKLINKVSLNRQVTHFEGITFKKEDETSVVVIIPKQNLKKTTKKTSFLVPEQL